MRGVVAGIIGFALGGVTAGGGLIYLVIQRENDSIVLPRKTYYDSARSAIGDGFVSISGSITGEHIGHSNNHFVAECAQERMVCDVMDYSQIGPNQIGPVTLEHWPIARWTPTLIVVRSEPQGANACSRVVLNILRRTEEVQYIREPINQASPACHDADLSLYRWRIDDSPWWRDMDQRMGERR